MRLIADDVSTQGRPEVGPSLDNRTHLDHGAGSFIVSVYPEAGEAVVAAAPPRNGAGLEVEWDADGVHIDPTAGAVDDIERQAQNWERANRRALSESRRYLVANRLRYMWVLTIEGEGLHGPDGRAEIMRRVAGFVRKLRRTYGELPYWFSPELHPGGHGWHVNFFVAKRLPHAVLQPMWGHGIVNVSDWATHRIVKKRGQGFLDALRAGAEYGCKYATKDWDAEQIGSNGRRYEAAEGFKPRKLSARVDTLAAGHRAAIRFFGGPASLEWRSWESEGWDGPSVVTMRWAIAKSPPGLGGHEPGSRAA